jgi:hypothetical protein
VAKWPRREADHSPVSNEEVKIHGYIVYTTVLFLTMLSVTALRERVLDSE